jgi:3'-phosphoadenosine 5'-phosphosulfate sulfotransferase (PAPS reductase)/FAD synthetase
MKTRRLPRRPPPPTAPPPTARQTIVCISGGAGSTIAALRCLEWYGPQKTTFLFADTNFESPDAYALIAALEARHPTGTHRLNQALDPWDLFLARGVMKLPSNGCIASVELKRKPLRKWLEEHYPPDAAQLATGLSWTEPERQARFQEKQEPYPAIFPLNYSPLLSNCDLITALEAQGLPVSAAYRAGYQHDNCNGACILAGHGQWADMLQRDPAHFATVRDKERAFYEQTGFTVLRDRRGGETNPYPLYQLQTDVDAGRTYPDTWRSTCACMQDE